MNVRPKERKERVVLYYKMVKPKITPVVHPGTVDCRLCSLKHCRQTLEHRMVLRPRRLKTSSMSRFGPMYSMFILPEDKRDIGRGNWKRSFWCHLDLMQSSTRAIKPVATIALRSLSQKHRSKPTLGNG